jgi:hypothetical protein
VVVAGLEVVGGLVVGGAGRVVGADRLTGGEVRGTVSTVVGAATALTLPAPPEASATARMAAAPAAKPIRRRMGRALSMEAGPDLT